MTAVSLTSQIAPVPARQPRAAFEGPRAWPIISRELRTEARSRSNAWLRLLSATAFTALCAGVLRQETWSSSALGIRLFTGIHTVLLLGIWFLGAALTSDAISIERREGTLSLLFATCLTARSIVLGKGFVHMARMATLWLAAFPVLTVALLLGGVTRLDVLSAFVIELCAGLWALPAGLIASTFAKKPIAAFLWSEALGLGLALALLRLLEMAWVLQLNLFAPIAGPLTRISPLPGFSLALLTGGGPQLGWSRPSDPLWLLILGELVLVSLFGFVLLLGFAAWRARRIWREVPLSVRQERRQRAWLVPRFWLRRFSERRQRWLNRNPLGWARESSTWVRASKLSWCCLVLLIESLVMLSPHPWEHFERAQFWTSALLSAVMTLAAVMVFRRERESGMLELLLVSPVSVDQIIWRQLCAFWRRFFLPVILLIGCGQLMVWLDMSNLGDFDFRLFLAFNFLTIPLIAFYASARFTSFPAALFLGAFFSLGLPLLGPELSPGLLDRISSLDIWFLSRWPTPPANSIFVGFPIRFAQGAMAVWCWSGLRSCLWRRTFWLRKGSNQ